LFHVLDDAKCRVRILLLTGLAKTTRLIVEHVAGVDDFEVAEAT
jgi:hypothetical protein